MTMLPFSNRSVVQSRQNRNQPKTTSRIVIDYWRKYCLKTHIHGIKYLADGSLHPLERILMSALLFLCVFGTVYVCILFSYKFQESALQIQVENTAYPVYYIAFPALTICNYNRLNWSRMGQAQKRFLPANATHQTIDLFQRFIAQFERLSFGQFSQFGKFNSRNLSELDAINITDVIQFLSYRCDELFQACWWKDRFVSCCDLFVQQKSESGFCLSFNSMTSEKSIDKQKTDMFYPWHVAKAGFNSALKVYIVLDKSKRSPFNNDSSNGVATIIHGSYQWPISEQFIPENSNVSISIDAKLSYANIDTYRLNPDFRECLFDHEQKYQWKYHTLPGLKYTRSNCIAQCHQHFVYGICNCSLELFYPVDEHLETCRASDFKCLYKYHSVLSQDREPDEELYINYTSDGMKCRCLSECYSVDFDPKILPISTPNASPKSNLGYLSIDMFYEKLTIIKYRLDVSFEFMDLIVAYGGIAGFFIGISLLSGVEFIYYFTIGLLIHMYDKGTCFEEDHYEVIDENIDTKKIKSIELNNSNNNNNVKVINIKVRPRNDYVKTVSELTK